MKDKSFVEGLINRSALVLALHHSQSGRTFPFRKVDLETIVGELIGWLEVMVSKETDETCTLGFW